LNPQVWPSNFILRRLALVRRRDAVSPQNEIGTTDLGCTSGQSFKFHFSRRGQLDSQNGLHSPRKMKFEGLTSALEPAGLSFQFHFAAVGVGSQKRCSFAAK
jgi:hypothetical protein